MALSNCEYNKAKLQHMLGCLSWFIKKHALDDAKQEQKEKLKEILEALHKDLEKYCDRLNELM